MKLSRRDFLAGISVAGVLLPESVVYAAIAGVPAAHGIVAALCGLLIYGVLGNSRFAIVAPTSSAAAILAAAAASLGFEGPEQKLIAIAALVLICGGLFVLAGLARMGSLSSFVSRPVLRGFAFGLGLTIVIKQLPTLLGLGHISGMPARILLQCMLQIQQWHMASLCTGLSALGLIILLKQVRNLPAALLVMIYGIGLSALLSLSAQGVDTVGRFDWQVIHPALPLLSWSDWLKLAELAPPLFLIIFAESWGSIRSLALLHEDSTRVNRELVALGWANIGAGVMQGLAVGAGFSASSANEAAGSQSRLSGILAAMTLGGFVLYAPQLVALLPEPVLAAVVIAALFHALDPRPLIRLWTINRDQYVALVAAGAVVSLGVLEGMLLAIVLSVLALIQRLAQPVVSTLGQLGDSHDFVDLAHYPEARTEADIIVLRPARPMFFANADGFSARILTKLQNHPARVVILSLEESPDFDSTAADTLAELRQQLQSQGRTLFLARVHSKIIELLQRYDHGTLADPARRGLSVADTVEMARDFLAEGRSVAADKQADRE